MLTSSEPGWIDTPGEHEAFGDELMAHAGSKLPWGRLGTPDDIGKASDSWPLMTLITLPACLRVDGGILLQHAHE